MANKILHTTIMQKNTTGGRNIIYPKTVTKNIIDGTSTLDQTLNTLKSSDISNKTTMFTQADTRQNLVSGETLATSQGKIMKLISDLKSLAYIDTVGVSNLDSTLTTAYNNRITTDMVTTSTTITNAGYVADARTVNSLQNQINTVNSNINSTFRIKDYISEDLDSETFGFCYTDQYTLNTPYKQGLTLATMGICFTGYNATNWNTQYFMTNDGPMYYRSSNNNGYGKWSKLVLNSDLEPLLITDANSATENRSYRLAGTSSNIPWSGIGCIINVNKYDNFIAQTAISNEPTPHIAIINNYPTHGWSTWKTLATK